MVAATQGTPRQPWWMDEHRLLVRRLDRLNFVHHELTEGLPPGLKVRRESTKTANDMLVIYIDGVSVERISNMKGDAAPTVAEWIELYRRESEAIMGMTEQGLALLKDLAAKGGTVKRAYAGAHGGVINALVKKGLVTADSKTISLTDAGRDELRGLPEFDGPTSPPAPLLEERGESEPISVDKPSVELFSATLQAAREGAMGEAGQMLADAVDKMAMKLADDVIVTMDALEEPQADRLVRIVMADEFGLDTVVTHCGSEIMGLGGTVIKLELKEALLREIYPALTQYLNGLDAIGVEYAVFGDLHIVVERPTDVDEPIPYELP